MTDEKTKNALRRLHRLIAEHIDPDVEIGKINFNTKDNDTKERVE